MSNGPNSRETNSNRIPSMAPSTAKRPSWLHYWTQPPALGNAFRSPSRSVQYLYTVRRPHNIRANPQSSSGTKRVIGVSRKCCWCCARLASHVASREGKTFILPGSHGQIFPWALPSGIPLEVADALEADLQSVLSEVLHNHYLSFQSIPLNETSSPAGPHDNLELHDAPDVDDRYMALRKGVLHYATRELTCLTVETPGHNAEGQPGFVM